MKSNVEHKTLTRKPYILAVKCSFELDYVPIHGELFAITSNLLKTPRPN